MVNGPILTGGGGAFSPRRTMAASCLLLAACRFLCSQGATGLHEIGLPFHERSCILRASRREISSSCKVGADMATLQVKGFDEALYKALGERAKRDNRSISQEVVKLIQDFLARPSGSAEEATRAFLALAGSWEDTRSARQIARDIRRAKDARDRLR